MPSPEVQNFIRAKFDQTTTKLSVCLIVVSLYLESIKHGTTSPNFKIFSLSLNFSMNVVVRYRPGVKNRLMFQDVTG
jgi:hypothetical protein